LVLCGMSAELRRLFDIGKFTELFTVSATRDEGLTKVAA
jgi:anti-anti-sigma regulatory factor